MKNRLGFANIESRKVAVTFGGGEENYRDAADNLPLNQTETRQLPVHLDLLF